MASFASSIAVGFAYNGPMYDFERQNFESIEQMRNADLSCYPQMYIATVTSTGEVYLLNKSNDIDPDTGKWRLLTTTSAAEPLNMTIVNRDNLLRVDNVDVVDEGTAVNVISSIQVGDRKLAIVDAEPLRLTKQVASGVALYHMYKGDKLLGTIDIDADMVVSGGEVLKVPAEGMEVASGIQYQCYDNGDNTIYLSPNDTLSPETEYYTYNGSEYELIGELKRSSVEDSVYAGASDTADNQFSAQDKVSSVLMHSILPEGVYLQLQIANQEYPVYINVKDIAGSYLDMEGTPLVSKSHSAVSGNSWGLSVQDKLYYLDDDSSADVGVSPEFADFFKALLTNKAANNKFIGCYPEHPTTDEALIQAAIGTASGVYFNTTDNLLYYAVNQQGHATWIPNKGITDAQKDALNQYLGSKLWEVTASFDNRNVWYTSDDSQLEPMAVTVTTTFAGKPCDTDADLGEGWSRISKGVYKYVSTNGTTPEQIFSYTDTEAGSLTYGATARETLDAVTQEVGGLKIGVVYCMQYDYYIQDIPLFDNTQEISASSMHPVRIFCDGVELSVKDLTEENGQYTFNIPILVGEGTTTIKNIETRKADAFTVITNNLLTEEV